MKLRHRNYLTVKKLRTRLKEYRELIRELVIQIEILETKTKKNVQSLQGFELVIDKLRKDAK